MIDLAYGYEQWPVSGRPLRWAARDRPSGDAGDARSRDDGRWLEAHRYLNMNDLKEHKKIQLRQAA